MPCLLVDDETVNQAVTQELGFTPKYGYVGAAKRLLSQVWHEKQKPSIVANTADDLRDVYSSEVRNHMPLDITWRRILSPGMIGHWIHCYDKNSQHLSAEQSVYTGYGDPTHVSGTCEPKLPGLYRVSWDVNGSRFDGKRYPTILDEGDTHCTRDVLKFAIEQGYNVQVLEAWVFPTHTRVFEEYAKRLWNARQTLKFTNAAAAQEVNQIAQVTGVWVSSQATKNSRSGKPDMLHPNWWADIVGCARVRLLANMLAYGPPVLIRTDALYYVSSRYDINEAIVHAKNGESITARNKECGGFKVPTNWVSFKLTRELYDEAEGKSDGELADMFKRAGGVK